jgi:hypothetical protein
MSGSKTAGLLLITGVLFSKQSWSKFATLFSIAVMAVIFSEDIAQVWRLLELREISTESGAIRGSDAEMVIRDFSNAGLLGLLFGISRESLVDNAYLDMVSYGGISSQLISIFICLRCNFWFGVYLHSLIFISMLTTNTPRLWPVAYIYWALVGVSVVKWLDRVRFPPSKTFKISLRYGDVQ